MSEGCTHDCGSCGASCDSREPDFRAAENAHSRVKKVIGIVSGKGGVGKSLVTSLLAVSARRLGHEVAILDADITGPSIPRAFGITEQLMATDEGMIPAATKTGIKLVSLNLLLESETDPVVWRGPVIADVVKQFWTEVMWEDVDYMFVDMPPGTGDVPLTVFQSLPVDGIILVTSPQELVGMIVTKAAKMAEMMKIPVLGLVENMSGFQCDECGKVHDIFGPSRMKEVAKDLEIPAFARLPINPKLAAACDSGMVELFHGDWLGPIVEAICKA